MKAILLAAVTAVTISGVAMAQTATDTSTTTTTQQAPDPAAPVAGTLSTTRAHKAEDAYGNSVDSKQTTYRNTNGVASDSQTTTQTVAPPPPPPVTTSTSTTETTETPHQ